MFSVHAAPQKFDNAPITGQFGFVFEENSGRSRDYCDVIVFEKLRFKPFSLARTKTQRQRFRLLLDVRTLLFRPNSRNKDEFSDFCGSVHGDPMGHVRYINIRAWLRGFRVKIFQVSFVHQFPKLRDLDTKKTAPNIEV